MPEPGPCSRPDPRAIVEASYKRTLIQTMTALYALNRSAVFFSRMELLNSAAVSAELLAQHEAIAAAIIAGDAEAAARLSASTSTMSARSWPKPSPPATAKPIAEARRRGALGWDRVVGVGGGAPVRLRALDRRMHGVAHHHPRQPSGNAQQRLPRTKRSRGRLGSATRTTDMRNKMANNRKCWAEQVRAGSGTSLCTRDNKLAS